MQTPETLNNLVTKARDGDQEALLHLWQGASRTAYKIALRYRNAAQLNGGVDVDDLKQCAFLGFFNAVNTYDPNKGEFMPHMAMRIKGECRKALGMVGRDRREHYETISLETPFAEDLTIEDTIDDPGAFEKFAHAELKADVHAALNRLPEKIRELIRLHDLQGLTMEQAAMLQDCTVIAARNRRRDGLRRMRKDRTIRDYDRGIRLRYSGIRAYNIDWMSVVEAEVIRRLDRKF